MIFEFSPFPWSWSTLPVMNESVQKWRNDEITWKRPKEGSELDWVSDAALHFPI